jgi:hypothetical protein
MNGYELLRPDGTGSGVWVCGECHKPHMVAQGLPVDVNKNAADECCRPRHCHYCGKPTERDARGRFQWSHAECIPKLDPPPPAHPSLTNPFARLLYKMMAGISEDCWCARWTGGHEYALWEILHGERPNYGPGVITSEVLEELRLLSRLANGWIWTGPNKEEFSPRLVSFVEWRSLLIKRRAK